MAKNIIEAANGLDEGLLLTPISTNQNSVVELPGEKDGVCRVEDENVSSSCCMPGRVRRSKLSVEKSSHTIDFCLDTSLHGLKYVGQPERHFLERLFWFSSFIIGCLVAALLIKDIWVKYYRNPIVVTFYPFETTIEQIPFPAVTICNMNKVLKSKAEKFIEAQKLWKEENDRDPNKFDIFQYEMPVYHLQQICSSSRSFSENFNDSSRNALSNISYTPIFGNMSINDLEGIMKYFNVSNYRHLHRWFTYFLLHIPIYQNPTTQFASKPTTCTFNMVPQALLHTYNNSDGEDSSFPRVKEKDKEEMANWPDMHLGIDGFLNPDSAKTRPKLPERQYRSGRSSGLSILVDPSLSEYFCTDSDSEGFLLQTHLPIDAPHVQDFGIAIKPNSEAFISIKPEITKADEDIRSYRMDKRECYFGGEFKLAYYNYYTVSNCLDECVANETYSSCKCVLFYMPRDNSRRICDPSKLECAEKKREEFLEHGIKNNCSYCYPTCMELEYLDELTSTPLQTSVNFMGNNYPEDVIRNGTRSNLSIIHIYFGQDSTYPRYRTKLFGLTDLIANTGGLMGLCLGFSGLSLIECFYYFTLRAWFRTPQSRLGKKSGTNSLGSLKKRSNSQPKPRIERVKFRKRSKLPQPPIGGRVLNAPDKG